MLRTFLILLFISTTMSAQLRIDRTKLSSDYVLKENRIEYKAELNSKVNSFLDYEPARNNEKSWISLFRELELTYFTGYKADSLIKKCFLHLPESGTKFKRALIEAVSTLSPGNYEDEISDMFVNTADVQVFGAAAMYLMKTDPERYNNNRIISVMSRQFPDYKTNDVLQFLYNDLTRDTTSAYFTPDLNDILKHDFQKGKTVIYSLQREDRTFPGITIVKGPDGKFVRNNDSTIFYVKQLACATSEFPGYLSQGNTPQGIFSIVGSYVSPTKSIGPTANVITRIPFEVSTSIYYHGQNNSDHWRLEDYLSLLPDDWRDYLPIREAFFAGKTGRRLIVMHGSTDDLSFYESLPYYPLTPSKGCLTTTEIWDENTGNCIRSDQVRLINAFYSTEQLSGFLVVVNIDNKKKPVSIEEILPCIEEFE